MFPLLLVLVSVLGIALADNPDLQQRILDSSLADFPVIGDQLRSNVHGLDRSGVALVVGLVVAFVGARGLADAGQNAFNSLWQVPFTKRPGFPASIARSLALLALIGVGVAVTGWTALVLADAGLGVAARIGMGCAGLLVSCALFVAGFRLATARVVPTRSLVAGAVVAAVVWQVLLGVGRLLVEHSLHGANQVYGAFATVIGLLAWFAIQAQVTLYAVELDVVRAHRLVPRSLAPPLTEADERALTSYAAAQARVAGQQVTVSYGAVSAPTPAGATEPIGQTEPAVGSEPGEPAPAVTGGRRPSSVWGRAWRWGWCGPGDAVDVTASSSSDTRFVNTPPRCLCRGPTTRTVDHGPGGGALRTRWGRQPRCSATRDDSWARM